MQMPMRIIVDRELPKNVQSINLSYALFDVTESFVGAADRATVGRDDSFAGGGE
jgi:cytochrome c oxidase assembly protein Cox11